MKKAKRTWTDEQKQAARERMTKRWVEARDKVVMGSPFVPEATLVAEVNGAAPGSFDAPFAVAVAPPEVEYIPMPEVPPVRDDTRVGSREVVLRVRTDGQMVSLEGPCLCGAVKRQWHQICLKESHAS